jgi:hypothetical protein
VQQPPRDQPVHSSSSFVYVGGRSAVAGFTGKDPLRFTASATFMRLSRRKFLHPAAGAAVVPGVARVVSASNYPTRPVRLIIGYPPGGSADMTARLTSQWLSERLGQQFIVESRPGAATNIATESVVRAAPDGYTLLLAAPANATNVALFAQLNFDFMRDVTRWLGLFAFLTSSTSTCRCRSTPSRS